MVSHRRRWKCGKERWSKRNRFSSISEFLIQSMSASLFFWSKIQLQRANLTNITLISAQRWRTRPSLLTRKRVLLGGRTFLPLWKSTGKEPFRSAMYSRGIIRMIDRKFRFRRRRERPVLSMIIQGIFAFSSNTTAVKRLLIQIHDRKKEKIQDVSNSGPLL